MVVQKDFQSGKNIVIYNKYLSLVYNKDDKKNSIEYYYFKIICK